MVGISVPMLEGASFAGLFNLGTHPANGVGGIGIAGSGLGEEEFSEVRREGGGGFMVVEGEVMEAADFSFFIPTGREVGAGSGAQPASGRFREFALLPQGFESIGP